MSAFNSFMRNPWMRTFFAFLLLGALVWFCGPLLAIGQVHPFDSEIIRLITIGCFILLWLFINLMRIHHARRKEKGLVQSVAAPDPNQVASAEEVALLGERLKEALQKLRTMPGGKRGRQRLYDLPWYMFIGPPGAGKTTALVNSGLKFPLADASGPTALKGVGGTRNCDWWFTDEAVLIDTAGRYATQDSQAAVDGPAWLGFLRLLKKHRRRQPVNGVFLSIGLPDLAALSEDERLAHAQAMRKRLRELHDELGVRIPVYVLFTKADLISGFVEFFDVLGKEEREQPWGATFAFDDGKSEGGAIAQFGPEFDALLARLNDRALERVHQETDIQRRRLLYAFPQQFAALRELTQDFLTEIFRPSRLEARPLLRGFYFTSGTQNGTPIDRLMSAMSDRFGLRRQSVRAFSGAGRSYFLTRVMRDVVFGEAGLVSLDPRVERRRRWNYRLAYSGAALTIILVTAGWTNSYIGNVLFIDEVHAAATKYNGLLEQLAKRGVNDTDLAATLPALDTLRTMRGGYDQQDAETPLELTFGLYQGNKLTNASVDAYYRALNTILLPRLLARLETKMKANLDKPDLLYETLKVYLILGKQAELRRDPVIAFFCGDFALNCNEPGDDDSIEDLTIVKHIEAMVQRPLTAVPLDGPLIARVREILTREPLAAYSYNRVLRSPAVKNLPDWTVGEAGGAASSRVFVLRSGKPITTGMPGIFTWSGYHDTFLPLMPELTKDIAEDVWVLGRERKGSTGIAGIDLKELSQLRRDVIGLYLDEYVRRWDRMIADIGVKSFGSPAEAADQLALMGGPNSPLRQLFKSIDRQTQLSVKGATDEAAAAAEAKATKLASKAAGLGTLIARSGLTVNQNLVAGMLGETFGVDPTTKKPFNPETKVDEHFKALHLFVAGGKNDPVPPMEAMLTKMDQLSQGFGTLANGPTGGIAATIGAGGAAGGGGGGAVAAGNAAQALKNLAKDVPKPIADMLQAVGDKSNDIIAKGASDELSKAWASEVAPFCEAALNRYPLISTSKDDVAPDDFATLLGPGGKIEGFFNARLKPFVDTTGKPWKWQAVNQAKLNLSAEALAQFERANLIKEALFGAGGSQVMVRFKLTPISADPSIARVTFDIAGQSVAYAQGPIESTQIQWPGQGGKTLIRATITPAAGGEPTTWENDGAWSLLHFIDWAKVQPGATPDKFKLTVMSPQGNAAFELAAASVRNPFTLAALRQFRCPSL